MGLIAGLEKYLKKSSHGALPQGLESKLHSIDWPIDTKANDFWIPGHFGERNYFNSSGPGSMHSAIDIQVDALVEVYSPESGWIYVEDDFARNEVYGASLANAFVYSDSGILYCFGHLDCFGYSGKINRARMHPSNTRIDKGELIGKVGVWHYALHRNKRLLPEVEKRFSRLANHLHFETRYLGNNPAEFLDARLSEGQRFNPLLVLKRLC